MSDNTGTLTDEYNYEAFGDVLSQTGTTENSYLFTGEQFDTTLDQYYLRARYYDQGVGRFTQADTWMGRNSDPITLHKYLYANADSVNYIDPTGNFSLGSFGAASNVQAVLSTASFASTAFDLFSLAEQGAGESASSVGASILLGLVGNKILKPIAALCKKNKKARRGCNYALGWSGAQLKMRNLVSSKSKSWINRKRIATVVGAFDVTTGKSAAAFNLGKQVRPATHPSLKRALNSISVSEGCDDSSVFGGSFKFGNCAEFLSANKLMWGKAKKKAIRWTSAYSINNKGSGPSLGDKKNYCANCVGLFGLRN